MSYWIGRVAPRLPPTIGGAHWSVERGGGGVIMLYPVPGWSLCATPGWDEPDVIALEIQSNAGRAHCIGDVRIPRTGLPEADAARYVAIVAPLVEAFRALYWARVAGWIVVEGAPPSDGVYHGLFRSREAAAAWASARMGDRDYVIEPLARAGD